VVVEFDDRTHDDLAVYQTELLTQLQRHFAALVFDVVDRLPHELVRHLLVAVLQLPVGDDDRDLAGLLEVLEDQLEFEQLDGFLGGVVHLAHELVEQSVNQIFVVFLANHFDALVELLLSRFELEFESLFGVALFHLGACCTSLVILAFVLFCYFLEFFFLLVDAVGESLFNHIGVGFHFVIHLSQQVTLLLFSCHN